MKTLLIAGDRSGSGKTSITLAITAILSRRYTVQTFKVGMDYIDPSYLTGVSGRPCRNLDTFILTEEENRAIFYHGSAGADIAIVEGVRGLYEGAESTEDIGSTASVAKLLNLPVILVIDARSITRSAAAIISGFKAFDKDIRITGIILNNIRGEGHLKKITEAINYYCNIPVIGAVPRVEDLDLTMRHLGLVPYEEGIRDQPFLNKIESIVEMICENLDLDLLLSLADDRDNPGSYEIFERSDVYSGVKIAIARDEVFNFYYSDLFSLLKNRGSDLVFFSPVRDTLPDADGYILGGGYPEYHGKELAENSAMLEDLRRVSADNRPILAECGGLMYLCREIRVEKAFSGLVKGTCFGMAGIIPADCTIPERRVVAYVTGTTTDQCPFSHASPLQIRGHAFHYSNIHPDKGVSYAYHLNRGYGIEASLDGIVTGKTIGSYTHIHPVASGDFLSAFMNECRE